MTAPEETADRDPLAVLEEIRKRCEAATPGTWVIEEKHGRDITDEGWSEVRVISVPSGRPVVLTYMDGVLEPDEAEENGAFIVTARTAMPRLLAIPDALLKVHRRGPFTVLGRLCKRHENHRHFSIDVNEAADVKSCPDCTATVYRSCAGCGRQVDVELCHVRTAIAAALAGEEVSS